MKEFELRKLKGEELEIAARDYAEKGFIILSGVEEDISKHFPALLPDIMEIEESELQTILNPQDGPRIFPTELRRRLAKVTTTHDLADLLISALKPVLARLLGPVVHISSTFHAQFKNGQVQEVDHGGYVSDFDYMEIHGPYLLHQDFAGASFPTSPSMMTLWVGLNTTSSWSLRLYPESHRKGLLCNKWLPLNDDHLNLIGEPVDIPACRGKAVLFNGMMLHGTGPKGPERRVSCDIRFFPFCGFLPSEAYLLDSQPHKVLMERANTEELIVLQAPLLEDLVFLGLGSEVSKLLNGNREAHSVLNWIDYISCTLQSDRQGAARSLAHFTNEEIGIDSADIFIKKFHGHPVHPETLKTLREKIAFLDPNEPRLRNLDQLMAGLAVKTT